VAYQICVSGASKGESVEEGKKLATLAGETIAKGRHTLITGATIGLPQYAAEAYKRAGGKISVGISPATSKVEHVFKYRLPTEVYDVIIYTGMHYTGRDVFVVTSSDAVLSIGGRLGTLHESMVAIETETPIGFLEGAGGTGAKIKDVLQAAGREDSENILFSYDPVELLDKLVLLLDKQHHKYHRLYE
jgi:hypothetical protein